MTGELKYTSDADRLERLLTNKPRPQPGDDREIEVRDRDPFDTDPPGRGDARGVER
jgi:hypothetical protein